MKAGGGDNVGAWSMMGKFMRSGRAHGSSAVVMLLLTGAAHAEEYRVECPLSIKADALKVVKTPANWTAAVQGPFWLHSAGPMDGPPADMAVLKDTGTRRVGKKTVTKWDMSAIFSAGKWMACNYGYSNDFILSKKLDEKTSACTVTNTEQASGKVEIDIRCTR